MKYKYTILMLCIISSFILAMGIFYRAIKQMPVPEPEIKYITVTDEMMKDLGVREQRAGIR